MIKSIKNKWTSLIAVLLYFSAISCSVPLELTVLATVNEDAIVRNFYELNNNQLFWFSTKKNFEKAKKWLTVIESDNNQGFYQDTLKTDQVHLALSKAGKSDELLREKADIQLTRLVLNFIKYQQEGDVHFEYDEVSISRDSIYINQLLNIKFGQSVSKIISELECKDPEYLVLKKYLQDSIAVMGKLKYKSVLLAMNYRKYLSANHQSDYVIANIPETEVRYYRNNQLALKMKSVVGKKKNPTPTIASYITDIVTFPFWNVPFSIASKELLPKVQKDESYLERNNFEVVDGKGNVIDDSDLNWETYTEKNFPYFFRESTGPNNSLGVLKFNLKNPFSIFLHDTNSKGGFSKDYRFLSHGCVRLEKPLELADLLTRGKIDVQAIKSGKENTESKTIRLDQKIPVFIIYVPVTVDGQKVTFLKDVYGLVQ